MTADKLEILELLNRYILSIDTHDDAQFADNFHDDAVTKKDGVWKLQRRAQTIDPSFKT